MRLTITSAVLISLVLTAGSVSSSATPLTDTPRIIGGGQAPPMPFVTRLTSDSGLCTATLIAPRFVLTALHCAGGRTTSFRVHSDNDALSGGEVITAVRSTKAPNADLAVFELSKEVSGPFVKLATEAPAIGTPVEIFGWGQVSNGGSQARKLKVGKVTFDKWTRDYKGGRALNLARVDGIAAPGDSGGPAMAGGVQVGVASTSDLRSNTQYTSVAEYAPWIKRVAGLS